MDTEELAASGRFERPVFRRYEWDHVYTTDEYIDLLLTYSNHRSLDATARDNVLRCIAELIDSRFDGHVTKR